MKKLPYAWAFAVFNPTASVPSLVQPLLMKSGGENLIFLQILSAPDQLEELVSIEYPEHGVSSLENHIPLESDAEPLWGFVFPDEPPIVGPWSKFRVWMSDRISDPSLKDKPLLQFSIVAALDIDEAKASVYTRAYHSLLEIGENAAKRWRDEAILEPSMALILARPGSKADGGLGLGIFPNQTEMRAKIEQGKVNIRTSQSVDEAQIGRLQAAYDALTKRFPDIFPREFRVQILSREKRVEDKRQLRKNIVVVLVGDIDRSEFDENSWRYLGFDVMDLKSYRSLDKVDRAPYFKIVIGYRRDWGDITLGKEEFDSDNTLLVSVVMSAAEQKPYPKLVQTSALPSLTVLSSDLYRVTSDEDPVYAFTPIFDTFMYAVSEGYPVVSFNVPSYDNIYLRERLNSKGNNIAAICRLSTRAVKAGARIDGNFAFYPRGTFTPEEFQAARDCFGIMFGEHVLNQTGVAAKETALSLICARSEPVDPRQHDGDRTAFVPQIEVVRRLFLMRGWKIKRYEKDHFTVASEDREFVVAMFDGETSVNDPYVNGAGPGLTRAKRLVVHWRASKSQLLYENLGQDFHINIEDVSQIVDGTYWVWKILRKQLFNQIALNTHGGRKLCAALVVEAIALDRIGDYEPELNLRLDKRFVRAEGFRAVLTNGGWAKWQRSNSFLPDYR